MSLLRSPSAIREASPRPDAERDPRYGSGTVARVSLSSFLHAGLLAVVSAPFAAVACSGENEVERDAAIPKDGPAEASPRDGTIHHPHDARSPDVEASDVKSTSDAPLEVYPAPHAPMPSVVDHGGPTLSAPVLVPVFYSGDPNQGDLVAFLSGLVTSSYWAATTSEYGIGAATVGTPIVIGTPPPATIDDTGIQKSLAENLTGAEPSWGSSSPNGIYILYFPPATTVTMPCVFCTAYHSGNVSDAGAGIVYAVLSEQLTPDVPSLTRLSSHEIVEAATDPNSTSGWIGTDANDAAWAIPFDGTGPVALGTPELGDMCEYYPSSRYTPPDLPYLVQRTWSNAAAAAGHDPCVPIPAGEVYFNSALVTTDNVEFFGGAVTHGVKIPLGTTRTVDVQLYSDAPTSGPWTVAASAFLGLLDFKFDKTTGQNGDTLHLTITAVAQDPTIHAEDFTITSTLGTMTTTWWGMIGN